MEVNLNSKLLENYFSILNDMSEYQQVQIWLKLSTYEWPKELGDRPGSSRVKSKIRVPDMDAMNPAMDFIFGDYRHYVDAVRKRIVMNVDVKRCLKAFNMLYMSEAVFEENWKQLTGS